MFGTVIEKGNTVAEIKLKASLKKERDLLTRSFGPELVESSDWNQIELGQRKIKKYQANFDRCSLQAAVCRSPKKIFNDDKMLIQMYLNWIKYVKETVPNDQLLIFNPKDGVEKIAEFVGRKTPNWKLPHMNGEIFSRLYILPFVTLNKDPLL